MTEKKILTREMLREGATLPLNYSLPRGWKVQEMIDRAVDLFLSQWYEGADIDSIFAMNASELWPDKSDTSPEVWTEGAAGDDMSKEHAEWLARWLADGEIAVGDIDERVGEIIRDDARSACVSMIRTQVERATGFDVADEGEGFGDEWEVKA